jgi:hypothetical protein
MRTNSSAAAIAVAALASVAVAAPATGESTPALDFDLGLGAQQPASPTSLVLHEVYKNPSDPDGKPSPLRKTVLEAPAGTVFDGHAVAACTAGDDQLMTDGPSACPTDSRVGTGTVALDTGFGPPVDPYMVDAILFNGGDGIIEVFSDHQTGARLAVGHGRFTAPNTLTETPARNPGGPPDGESSVRQVDFRFTERRGAGGRAFITTPPSCPAAGTWASKLTATVADGHTYVVTSTTPCAATGVVERPQPRPAPPAIDVRVSPRRVRAGTRTRFDVRLRSSVVGCLAGATIRFHGIKTRTDTSGRTTLALRPRRPGRYLLTATHAGCRAGRATIVVAPGSHTSR